VGNKGPTGDAGLPVIVGVHTFSGAVAANIPALSANFVFAGGTTSVVLAAPGHISGAATMSVGVTTASTIVMADLCYQVGAGPLVNFEPVNYVQSVVGNPQVSVAAAGSVSLPAGTYTVGVCARNGGAQDLDANDYASGWVMVSN
jgi:hypothetical protein